MVLTHQTSHIYQYPFPTVTLAYYLRYTSPNLNPFARHVVSTDTIESRIDDQGRLHTTRIHLKKSRIPAAVFKLLPTSLTGTGSTGNDRASYILETTTVDVKEGWMETESRNLNWTGILSVVERQRYGARADSKDSTFVTTDLIFKSRFGERLRDTRDELLGRGQQGLLGWAAGGWGAKGIQKAVETIASTKTIDQLTKSREGMRVVLERLRLSGGIVGVLEQRRRDLLSGEI